MGDVTAMDASDSTEKACQGEPDDIVLRNKRYSPTDVSVGRSAYSFRS